MASTIDAPTTVRIRCAGCGKRAKVAAKLAGRRVRCKCGEKIRVPGEKPSEPAVPTVSRERKPRAVSRGEARRKARAREAAVAERQAPVHPDPSEQARRRPEPSEVVPRLYHHEEHIKAIAAWMCLYGVLSTLVLLFLFKSFGLAGGMLLVGGIGISTAGAQLAAGYWLWTYDPRARMATAGLMGLMLLFALIGATKGGVIGLMITAGWCGAIGWALFGSKGNAVFSPAYRSRVRSERVSIRWWKSPFWYVPWTLLVIGVVIVLKLMALMS